MLLGGENSAITLHLLILLFLAGISHAGQVSPLSPDEVVKLVHDRRLEGLKTVWQQLGIKSKLFDYRGPEKVERFHEEIDGRAGPEVLLRISNDGWDWQYLIFSPRGENWYFFGNIDFDLQKYSRPEYKIVKKTSYPSDREKTGPGWLVITSLEDSGTDISLYEDHWWDLSGDELKEVLVYPVKGYVIGWGMSFDREYGSKILGFDKHPIEKFRVYAAFWAIYYVGAEHSKGYLDEVLFSTAKRVTYVWDSTKGRFVIDPQLSDMTEEQVDGLHRDGSDGFLKHNFDEIKKLASSKEENKREWLKRFLRDRGDSPEKTALLELLR